MCTAEGQDIWWEQNIAYSTWYEDKKRHYSSESEASTNANTIENVMAMSGSGVV